MLQDVPWRLDGIITWLVLQKIRKHIEWYRQLQYAWCSIQALQLRQFRQCVILWWRDWHEIFGDAPFVGLLCRVGFLWLPGMVAEHFAVDPIFVDGEGVQHGWQCTELRDRFQQWLRTRFVGNTSGWRELFGRAIHKYVLARWERRGDVNRLAKVHLVASLSVFQWSAGTCSERTAFLQVSRATWVGLGWCRHIGRHGRCWIRHGRLQRVTRQLEVD